MSQLSRSRRRPVQIRTGRTAPGARWLHKAPRLSSLMVAGYAPPAASLLFGAQTGRAGSVLKARCLAVLLLLGAVLLPATPAAGQTVAAPTATTISGHSSGFVTGAGQVLTANVTPANAPTGHTPVYQWYRGVDASGNSGSTLSGASGNTYTTVNGDHGWRLGLGVRHRRTRDDAMSPETRATTFVGVRPEPWSRGSLGFHGADTMVGSFQFLTAVGSSPNGFRELLQVQRRLGSLSLEDNSWATVQESRHGTIQTTFGIGDIGYSFRLCAIHEAVPPRVISSEPTCFLIDSGRVVRPLPLTYGSGTIANQTYVVDTPIPALSLPAVSGGSGNNSYTLMPNLPAGLSFNAGTRLLSGTPATAMAASAYTYTVTDVASSNTSLIFTIRVVPGVSVSPTVLTVAEGGSDSYTLVLNAQPTAAVTIAVTRSDDTSLSAVPNLLTFAPAAWSTALTVAVSAAEDNDATDGVARFSHTATSTDSNYNNIPIAKVVATEYDDETLRLRLRIFLEGPLR